MSDDTAPPTQIILGPPFHRHWQGAAGYSIKAYTGGRVPFRVERQICMLDDDAYIVVNAGQDYEFRTPAESGLFNFTIFISHADVKDAWASARCPERHLLDAPDRHAAEPDFFVAPMRPSPEVCALRGDLRLLAQSGALAPDLKAALIADLVRHAMRAQLLAIGETRRVPAVRRSTREEAVRRVRRALDIIESDIAQPLDLDALAAASCMAKHHFLRRFRDVTGETPYQFVLRRRLSRARELLRTGSDSAAEVGRACGFSDASAFSAAFRAAHGQPPHAWRLGQRRPNASDAQSSGEESTLLEIRQPSRSRSSVK